MLKSKCGGFSTLDQELINHPLYFFKPSMNAEFIKWTVFQQTLCTAMNYLFTYVYTRVCLFDNNYVSVAYNAVNTKCIMYHF